MNLKLLLLVVGLPLIAFPLIFIALDDQTEPKDTQTTSRQLGQSHEEEMARAPRNPDLRNSKASPESSEQVPLVRWEELERMNYQTGKVPNELRKSLQDTVRIPGFVVPLDLYAKEAKEFILVPTFDACIHVPPPPPNQMILVNMRQGFAPKRDDGPVWAYGKISIADSETEWGKVGYMMSAERTSPFEGGY